MQVEFVLTFPFLLNSSFWIFQFWSSTMRTKNVNVKMIISHILKHNENRRQSECMKLKVPSWVQNIRWYAQYFLELDSREYQTLLFPSRPLQNCWPPSSQCEPSQPRIVLILTISITSSMWSCRLVAVNYPKSVISCFFWMCRSIKIRSEILQQLQNI